jgi:predicted phosphodiesterase
MTFLLGVTLYGRRIAPQISVSFMGKKGKMSAINSHCHVAIRRGRSIPILTIMRFLIVSDIHGNRFGLEALLAEARGEYDRVLCLGDVVGYGAHPNECCEMLREADAWSLLGNHDAAALGAIDIDWFNHVARAAILWTRDQLTPENRSWLQSLQPTFDSGEHDFQAVHGSLREPLEEYITAPAVAETTLLLMKRTLCFYGHTHVADCYRCPAGRSKWKKWDQLEYAPLTEGGFIEPEESWKYLVNPGSCGQPRDRNPQARYAIFDTAERNIDVRALDYDWAAARAAILQAGLPAFLGDRLLSGR